VFFLKYAIHRAKQVIYKLKKKKEKVIQINCHLMTSKNRTQ